MASRALSRERDWREPPLPRLVRRNAARRARPSRRNRPEPPSKLTGVGASLISLAVSVVFGYLDAKVHPGLGWIYALAFVTVSMWVAARTRQRNLYTASVLPPPCYAAAAFLVAVVNPPVPRGAGLGNLVREWLTTMGDASPVLFVGAALALGLTLRRRTTGW